MPEGSVAHFTSTVPLGPRRIEPFSITCRALQGTAGHCRVQEGSPEKFWKGSKCNSESESNSNNTLGTRCYESDYSCLNIAQHLLYVFNIVQNVQSRTELAHVGSQLLAPSTSSRAFFTLGDFTLGDLASAILRQRWAKANFVADTGDTGDVAVTRALITTISSSLPCPATPATRATRATRATAGCTLGVDGAAEAAGSLGSTSLASLLAKSNSFWWHDSLGWFTWLRWLKMSNPKRMVMDGAWLMMVQIYANCAWKTTRIHKASQNVSHILP